MSGQWIIGISGSWRLALATVAAMLTLPAAVAGADTYVVTTNANTGEGSLRDRISDANADTTGAPHTVDATGRSGTILLASQLPTLTRNMTIQGPGANALTVFRNSVMDQYRIFSIGSGVTATISGLTIRNGSVSSGIGGGIDNAGILTLDRSVVRGNSAANGGGIRNWRTLTIQNSTVSGNTASNFGGGVYTTSAAVGLTSTVTIRNSTVAGNTAGASGGGGIAIGGNSVTIENSTVSGNSASTAANLHLPSGRTSSIRSTIVSNPLGGGGNCGGAGIWGSQGFNIESGNSCVFGQATDQPNTDPALGPLADNGGPTQTMTLPAGSPAVDTGFSGGLTTDQRGLGRPVDDPAIVNPSGGDGADVGAFELQSISSSPDPGGGDPPPGDPPPGSPDGPPGIELAGKTNQDLRRRVTVRATVDEDATLLGTGRLRVKQTGGGQASQASQSFGLRQTTVALAAGGSARLKLRLRRKAFAAASDVGKAKARIKVTATDSVGNSSDATRVVRLTD